MKMCNKCHKKGHPQIMNLCVDEVSDSFVYYCDRCYGKIRSELYEKLSTAKELV